MVFAWWKNKNRRRRSKSGPLSPHAKFFFAERILSQQQQIKKRTKSRSQKPHTITETGEGKWLVSGGQCDHLVILRGRELVCTDHTPAHEPVKDGYACIHESAVQRLLIQQIADTIPGKEYVSSEK